MSPPVSSLSLLDSMASTFLSMSPPTAPTDGADPLFAFHPWTVPSISPSDLYERFPVISVWGFSSETFPPPETRSDLILALLSSSTLPAVTTVPFFPPELAYRPSEELYESTYALLSRSSLPPEAVETMPPETGGRSMGVTSVSVTD